MMAIIDKHILAIVNNKYGMNDFCDSIWDKEDFIEYLEEIEYNSNLDLTYRYNWDMYKYEVINYLYGDHIREQFFNNTVRAIEDLTDSDKINILKYLLGEAVKPDCDISMDFISHQCYNDDWKSLICDYMYLKAQNMIFNEEGLLQDSLIRNIEDCMCDRLRERAIKNIAINKIKRNEIFNLGLGLKLSIKNCGITMST